MILRTGNERRGQKSILGKNPDDVREVEAFVPVGIEKSHVALTEVVSVARKLQWKPLKEVPKQADGIGDVEIAVLVAVAGLLNGLCRA